jgi:hypothetical protein
MIRPIDITLTPWAATGCSLPSMNFGSATAPCAQAGELFPVQPLGVERDNLNEAYQRALAAQPDQKKALAARRAAFLAFAAKVCSGRDIHREACLGRLYNNEAAAFDIPLRTVGPFRLRPVQAFGGAGARPYSLSLVELSRTDGKPDPGLAAFNRGLRAQALRVVGDHGEPNLLNDVNALVSSAGGGLISVKLSMGRIGIVEGEENKTSETECLGGFNWVRTPGRSLIFDDLFDHPQQALDALRPTVEGKATAAEFADPARWVFAHDRLQFIRPSAGCFDDEHQLIDLPWGLARPYLRKGGPVDLTALVDVGYD